MTVKLDSLQSTTIELELTSEHVNSLRRRAQQAVENNDDGKPAHEVVVNAVFKALGEWADMLVIGCCDACGGQGARLYVDDADSQFGEGEHMDACDACLGTGHKHSSNVPCPNQILTSGETWMQAHRRGKELQKQAHDLIHIAQHEMRCPHRAEHPKMENVVARCSLTKGHDGRCDPTGSDEKGFKDVRT